MVVALFTKLDLFHIAHSKIRHARVEKVRFVCPM